MSDAPRKRITINAALLNMVGGPSGGKQNATRKQRKEKPPTHAGSSTSLRKALLAKLKLQRAEDADRQSSARTDVLAATRGPVTQSAGPTPTLASATAKPQNEDFQGAVSYLNALVAKRKEERRRRRSPKLQAPPPPALVPAHVPAPQLVPTTHLVPAPQLVPTHVPTTHLAPTHVPTTHLAPTTHLVPTHAPVLTIDTPVATVLPAALAMPSTTRGPGPALVHTLSARPKRFCRNRSVRAPAPRPHVAHAPPAAPQAHVPPTAPQAHVPPAYSNLKGGTRPTYRQLFGRTLKAAPTPIKITNQSEKDVARHRRAILDEIKKDRAEAADKSAPRMEKVRRIHRKSRRTTTRTFKLGRIGGKVGVLLKDQKTRRRITEEHTALKRKHIKDVRQYLRDRNLVKAGSSAPNEVTRAIFVNSILTGEVHNRNEKVALHNFTYKDE